MTEAQGGECAETDQTDQTPECNGICVTAAEVGVPVGGIAFAHPDCEKHGTARRDSHAADCAAVAYERPYPCDCGSPPDYMRRWDLDALAQPCRDCEVGEPHMCPRMSLPPGQQDPS